MARLCCRVGRLAMYALALSAAARPVHAARLVEPSFELAIIPRSAWDARAPRLWGTRRCTKVAPADYRWIIVHHSAAHVSRGPAAITKNHLARGFADVGYHFIIDKRGLIYEGRDLRCMGAHAGASDASERALAQARKNRGRRALRAARRLDPDYGAIGIVVDASFTQSRLPSARQLASLERLVTHLRARFGIASSHVIAHREVPEQMLEPRGHALASKPTVCPGSMLAQLVTELRDARDAWAVSRAEPQQRRGARR